MKRDFSREIKDLDDNPIYLPATPEQLARSLLAIRNKVPDDVKAEIDELIHTELAKPLTLAVVCVNALTGAYGGEEGLPPEDRAKRMALARKLHKGAVVDVTLDELSLIKPLITKRYSGIIIPVIASELLELET